MKIISLLSSLQNNTLASIINSQHPDSVFHTHIRKVTILDEPSSDNYQNCSINKAEVHDHPPHALPCVICQLYLIPLINSFSISTKIISDLLHTSQTYGIHLWTIVKNFSLQLKFQLESLSFSPSAIQLLLHILDPIL